MFWIILLLNSYIIPQESNGLKLCSNVTSSSLTICKLGVKIRNLKVDFKTGGTWRRVGQ